MLNTGPDNDQNADYADYADHAKKSRAARELAIKELIKQCGGLIEFVRGKHSIPVGTSFSCPYMRAIEECLHKLQS